MATFVRSPTPVPPQAPRDTRPEIIISLENTTICCEKYQDHARSINGNKQSSAAPEFIYYTLQTMSESLETLQRLDVSKVSDGKQLAQATFHALHICIEKYWDLLDALRDGTTNGGQSSYLNTDPYWWISLELEAHSQIFQELRNTLTEKFDDGDADVTAADKLFAQTTQYIGLTLDALGYEDILQTK